MLPYGQPPSVHTSIPLKSTIGRGQKSAAEACAIPGQTDLKEMCGGLLVGYLAASFPSVGLHGYSGSAIAPSDYLDRIAAVHHVADLLF